MLQYFETNENLLLHNLHHIIQDILFSNLHVNNVSAVLYHCFKQLRNKEGINRNK